MTPATYHHFGLLSVGLIVLGLAFLLWRWPQGKHMTFSQHAAQHRASILFYFLFFSFVLPLLYLFFTRWFIPTFEPPALFAVAITAAILFQYSVTIVPETGGWKTMYHVFGATMSGLCMLLSLACLLFVPTIGLAAKITILTCAMTMSGLLYIGTVTKITHPNLLILQGAYYAAFFTAIMATTYFG